MKKNPTSNIFEALQNVNGVRPQLNCSICNTGDIHINGLEGPYTMVTIDGMPIVSSLSTVYGLSGIPNSLIERVEVVKGPASSLYGSEAVGGLINIITKKPLSAPLFSADIFSTSWIETNVDLGFKSAIGKKATTLVGINYYNFNDKIDNNNDNFTDVTLQEGISLFNKWSFDRKDNKEFTLAGRFFYEDRWGGEMQWNKSYRGGSEVYGEVFIPEDLNC
nr:TonB-dependent receptor plug domain-containing protein [Flavobacterium sp. LB-N7T]